MSHHRMRSSLEKELNLTEEPQPASKLAGRNTKNRKEEG